MSIKKSVDRVLLLIVLKRFDLFVLQYTDRSVKKLNFFPQT